MCSIIESHYVSEFIVFFICSCAAPAALVAAQAVSASMDQNFCPFFDMRLVELVLDVLVILVRFLKRLNHQSFQCHWFCHVYSGLCFWFAESNVGVIVGVVVGVIALLVIILLAVIFGRKYSRRQNLAKEHGKQSGIDLTRTVSSTYSLMM